MHRMDVAFATHPPAGPGRPASHALPAPVDVLTTPASWITRVTVTSNGRAWPTRSLPGAWQPPRALLISIHGSRPEIHEGLTRSEAPLPRRCAHRHVRWPVLRVGANTTVVQPTWRT